MTTTDDRPTDKTWTFLDVGEDGDAFDLKIVVHSPGYV
jgi:hypothetical protein